MDDVPPEALTFLVFFLSSSILVHPLQLPFGHNRHGPKSGGGCCAPFREGTGSPSNTMSHGPRPTSVLCGVLIHATVWPQYTNVTDMQTDRLRDRTDRQTTVR